MKDSYDIVVIGSGLGGMTAANTLARSGFKVLLCEQHFQLGGLAAWFRRPGGLIFDVSLHGFPVGMIKSCRRYWTKEIADRIVQLKNIKFDNPMFSLTTTFNREDFTELLVNKFNVPRENVVAFFDHARLMNFTDDLTLTARDLFEQHFPGRKDVVRLLMEPITYANGSTLDDPAVSYGIVFSNFMSKGVFTFSGGTDQLIELMKAEMLKNGVDISMRTKAVGIDVDESDGKRKVSSVMLATPDGKKIVKTRAVVSNGNLLTTIFDMVGGFHFDPNFIQQAKSVRVNNSSTQVYIGMAEGDMLDEDVCGDLLFTSVAPEFDTDMLLSRNITSRTYSFYYPKTRPGVNRCAIVASSNANFADWNNLSPERYKESKQDLINTTLDALEKYVPNIHERAIYTEAATPKTFQRYTLHLAGASFGTKFEGLDVSRHLPDQIAGLYHTGSVGIIMSGWLGAVNYGVIVSNDVAAALG